MSSHRATNKVSTRKPGSGKHPNSIKNLKPQRSDEPSRNPAGRPPSLLGGLLRELKEKGYERVNLGMIKETYEYLLGLPKEMLDEIVKNEETTFAVRIIIREMYSRKGADMIERMQYRLYGAPQANIDITTAGNEIKAPVIGVVSMEEVMNHLKQTTKTK